MIKKVGVTHADRGCAGTRDKEIKQSIVVIIAPDCGPGVGVVIDMGLVTHIGKGAVAVIPIEAVT